MEIFLSSPEDAFLLLLRERKRNIDVRETHQLVAFLCAPRPGIKPATWVCALTGNQTCDFSVYRMTLQPAEPHRPGLYGDFLKLYLFIYLLGQYL